MGFKAPTTRNQPRHLWARPAGHQYASTCELRGEPELGRRRFSVRPTVLSQLTDATTRSAVGKMAHRRRYSDTSRASLRSSDPLTRAKQQNLPHCEAAQAQGRGAPTRCCASRAQRRAGSRQVHLRHALAARGFQRADSAGQPDVTVTLELIQIPSQCRECCAAAASSPAARASSASVMTPDCPQRVSHTSIRRG